jgi:predicted dithiol-disulfide oxidoreductase (DUF899 family)
MESLESTINRLQEEIFQKQKALALLIKSQEPERIQNYAFKNTENEPVHLLDLFEGKDELVLIHNMGKSCVYCTMWADTLSGSYPIIKNRVKIVLTTPDDVPEMLEFSNSRHWKIPCFSYYGTDFSVDLGFASDKEGRRCYEPGFSILTQKDGKIFRTAKDRFGPGDVYCAPWHLFELLPKSLDGWHPKYKY